VSLTSVDLPEPETPVTQVKRPTGSATVDVLQVVAARALDPEPRLGGGAGRRFGTGMRSACAR
jgi:hypothetical protein